MSNKSVNIDTLVDKIFKAIDANCCRLSTGLDFDVGGAMEDIKRLLTREICGETIELLFDSDLGTFFFRGSDDYHKYNCLPVKISKDRLDLGNRWIIDNFQYTFDPNTGILIDIARIDNDTLVDLAVHTLHEDDAALALLRVSDKTLTDVISEIRAA